MLQQKVINNYSQFVDRVEGRWFISFRTLESELHTVVCGVSRDEGLQGFFFMPKVYEICGDEAWVHGSRPLNRYWCFFGGIFAPETVADQLETCLRDCLAQHGHSDEVKWGKLNLLNQNLYRKLIDIFFEHLLKHDIRYRQLFLDRAFVHVPTNEEPTLTDLDIQFRVCYQFLKHSFGLAYMPFATDDYTTIYIRLDTHSSQRHKDKLCELVETLPILLNRTDLDIRLGHVRSHHLIRLGICDVLLGAAGSYGNRMHDRRASGQRGMSDKQKCRLEFAKYIYNRLREINNSTRNKNAFNWFESTSLDGDITNRFAHRLRIWKFHPKSYMIDKGWQNDHLDKYGLYQKSEIVASPATSNPMDDYLP